MNERIKSTSSKEFWGCILTLNLFLREKKDDLDLFWPMSKK